MTLGAKQRIFTRLVGMLILKAYEMGYELTFGDAYRSVAQAMANASLGTGIANSNHTRRLAVDFNLFKDGVYLTDSEAYRPLGEWWESLSTSEYECAWGGRFKRPDGNHFSLAHEGVR